MAEASVTRAAIRLGISQPALSEALGRLRHLFHDELFVRDRGRMMPTRKAHALAAPIAAALANIRVALEDGARFNPATSSRLFRLGTGDYGEAIILPRLVERFSRDAPQAGLRVVAITPANVPEHLDRGDIDLAIDAFPTALPDRFSQTKLLDEHALCVTADGIELDEANYLNTPHVVRSPTGSVGSGVVDDALRQRGVERRVIVNVTNVLALPLILLQARLVATQPSRIARLLAAKGELRVQAPPIDIRSWTVDLVAGARALHDPALAWFARQIQDICNDL